MVQASWSLQGDPLFSGNTSHSPVPGLHSKEEQVPGGVSGQLVASVASF